MSKKREGTNVKLIVAIILIAAGIFNIFVFRDVVKTCEITDVNYYGKYEGAFIYDTVMFPEKILPEAEVVKYRYVMRSDLIDDSQYILLVCKYDSATYEAEKKRVSEVKDEYGEATYDENTFVFPAYVYMYNEGDSSQYALVDDESQTIYYVYIFNPFDFKDEETYERSLVI